MYFDGTIMENIVTIFLGKNVFRNSLSLEIDQIVNYIRKLSKHMT